ncbi:MAG: flagellar export protein FliJ [Rhodoferax sp.]|nr:flagellar export protein FliJ [Rhodoferax sp.]
MSALKSVLLAIEHASLRRDELAKAVARVERSQTFARDQMAQLKGYAADTDARWTGSGARGLSLELVRHQYQFMDRLQQAIELQSGVLANTARQLELAKANLMQAEIRLSGLNQILKSRQIAMLSQQRRREQRQTDEFAALQYTRNRALPMSGEKHDH